MDVQQICYHIVCPQGGDAFDHSENIKCCLSCYCAGTEQDLVLDMYDTLSAKDHEQM